MEKKKSTEEKPPENTINEKIKDFPDKNSLKELDDLCQIKHALDLANTKINEKAINKILKEKPFIVPVILGKPKSENEKEKESKKEEKKRLLRLLSILYVSFWYNKNIEKKF